MNFTSSFKDLGLPADQVEGFDAYDVFSKYYWGYMPPDAEFTVTIPPNGVRLITFGPAE